MTAHDPDVAAVRKWGGWWRGHCVTCGLAANRCECERTTMTDHDPDVAGRAVRVSWRLARGLEGAEVTHDPDVAAVLAYEFLLTEIPGEEIGGRVADQLARRALAALTAAGIACVYVPEGVAVEHGARLDQITHDDFMPLYTIEPPSEAP